MRQHRLIYDNPTIGSVNMAVDEAIMSAVAEGSSPPTLRLYAWNPPCLSLGYGQKWQDADIERISAAGWGLVRRATGGRAILHQREVTYSLMIPADHPLAQGDITESYRHISKALLRAVTHLGAMVQADKQAERVRATASGPVCFETPSHYEITTGDGRKLIGSAQLRRKGAVLQHGSLPLYGDVAEICDALVYPDEAARQRAKDKVHRRAATLADALDGEMLDWDVVAQAIINGFMETFDLDMVEAGLTDDERELAEYLEQTVYSSTSWTTRI